MLRALPRPRPGARAPHPTRPRSRASWASSRLPMAAVSGSAEAAYSVEQRDAGVVPARVQHERRPSHPAARSANGRVRRIRRRREMARGRGPQIDEQEGAADDRVAGGDGVAELARRLPPRECGHDRGAEAEHLGVRAAQRPVVRERGEDRRRRSPVAPPSSAERSTATRLSCSAVTRWNVATCSRAVHQDERVAAEGGGPRIHTGHHVVHLAGREQFAVAELADGLEHPVAQQAGSGVLRHRHQRLVRPARRGRREPRRTPGRRRPPPLRR